MADIIDDFMEGFDDFIDEMPTPEDPDTYPMSAKITTSNYHLKSTSNLLRSRRINNQWVQRIITKI